MNERNDDFYCRICLGLEYRSHQTNYRSLAAVAFARMDRLQKKALEPAYTFYKGKRTRRGERQVKLHWQIETGMQAAAAYFRGQTSS